MNALVSMHGIWLLVFPPIAAVMAWRYSSPTLRRLALLLLVLTAVFLTGWFGYLSVNGSQFTDSIFDRVMHSLGVIVGSINFPILQLLLAAFVIVWWPRKLEFRRQRIDAQFSGN